MLIRVRGLSRLGWRGGFSTINEFIRNSLNIFSRIVYRHLRMVFKSHGQDEYQCVLGSDSL